MPVVKLEDGTGEKLRVLQVDGYNLPTFDTVFDDQEAEFRTMVDWSAKPNDVLICAYPKAGTHWLWEMTSMLVNGSSDRIKLIKETSMLEGITKQMYDNVAEPRVLNTHIPFHYLPKNTLQQKCKILFVQRNPKDICVSFYNHHSKVLEYEYDGKFENYVKRFINGLVDYGSWFDYTLSWEKVIRDNPQHPVHILSYENLKQLVEKYMHFGYHLVTEGYRDHRHGVVYVMRWSLNPPNYFFMKNLLVRNEDSVTELKKIRDFLGVKADEELLTDIADKCEFSKMKKEKDPLENGAEWKDGKPGMYRKGQVGDWKNWFTVAQNDYFDKVYAEKMKDSSFTYRFS